MNWHSTESDEWMSGSYKIHQIGPERFELRKAITLDKQSYWETLFVWPTRELCERSADKREAR